MKKLLQWTLDNLDTTLAVVVSVVAALFGAFGLFQSAVLPAISGALALLAISIIRDRGARDSLMAEIQKLQGTLRAIQSKPSADTFFKTRTPETTLISKAREEIWLVQETGSKVIEENFKPLEALIKRGGKVRLILASNDPKVVALIAFRNRNLNAASLTSRQNNAILYIESLYRAIKGASGSLEVRHLAYPLDITAVFIDPESAETTYREGLVRMVGFQNFFDDKRDFLITYSVEPETYQYFSQQFREMWKLSSDIDRASHEGH